MVATLSFFLVKCGLIYVPTSPLSPMIVFRTSRVENLRLFSMFTIITRQIDGNQMPDQKCFVLFQQRVRRWC